MSVPAHPLRIRRRMGRTLSAFAVALMALAPVCTTIACGPAARPFNDDYLGGNDDDPRGDDDPTGNDDPMGNDDDPTGNDEPMGNDDDPANPEQTSVCEPRQAGISADFELIVEDWPKEPSDVYDYNLAAPCQVEAASAASRDLACTSADGTVHGLTLTISNPHILGAIPASGPVFLRAARYAEFDAVYQWFEVRAGSDVTGALLAGGVRASSWTPEGYFAPISMLPATGEGCPLEIRDEYRSSRRSRISFRVGGVPGASILDGHEGDIDASGAYRAIVGTSVDNYARGPDAYLPSDDPSYADEWRVLIGAKANDGP
ncbi:hypothetical protein [Sorangium sp. So ce204]|uniref:hypothetical protein n=1 Tax=Sorangium sp. So ce204 TaxID=3133288 RepID=UPI003F5E5299